jgi:Dockerin type I domain/Thrombospondin type 3 repeat
MRPIENWDVPRRTALRWIVVLVAGFGLVMLLPHRPAVHAQQTMPDTDGDGVPDAIDNCILVPNPDQRDTHGNGFGNACNADLNNDGVVNSIDFSILKTRLFTNNPDADLNGDGVVNSIDFSIMKTLLLKPLGPSCCGAASRTLDVSVPKTPEPPPASIDTFAVTGSVPGQIPGKNGVMCETFTPGVIQQFNLGNTVVVTAGGNGDVLNDSGVPPDQKAGDGIYCGFSRLDPSQTPTQQAADIQIFTNRVNALGGGASPSLQFAPQAAITVPNVNVGIFNGRALADTLNQFTFTVATPAAPLANLVGFPSFTAPTLPPALCNEDRCLAITDLSAVADPTRTFDVCNTNGTGNNVNPNGAWSFKTLLSNMANTSVTGVTAQVFIHAWLSRWLTNQTALNADGSANAFLFRIVVRASTSF